MLYYVETQPKGQLYIHCCQGDIVDWQLYIYISIYINLLSALLNNVSKYIDF